MDEKIIIILLVGKIELKPVEEIDECVGSIEHISLKKVEYVQKLLKLASYFSSINQELPNIVQRPNLR
jgi:hypothetical protein